MKVGDLVRLVYTGDLGPVLKKDDGRLVTVRALGDRDPDFAVCVDDGDPADPDVHTNGFRVAYWLPLKSVQRLADRQAGGGGE